MMGSSPQMTFEGALSHLKDGGRVVRLGWNGKGMFLLMISNWTYEIGPRYPEIHPVLPFIAIKTADNKVVPWYPSQPDLMANDWVATA